MANTLKVKRSATYSSTTNPSSLAYGEAAWNNGSSKLFIGKQTDGGGTVESFHISSLADLSVGEGLDISLGSGNTDNAATLSAEDATSSNKGVASFHTDNFSVSSGAVTIKDLGVATAELANDAVTGAKIADNAIDSEHIAADSIDAEHYAAGSVDATALAANSVDSSELVNGSIDTAHIADDQVTADKIVDNIALAGNCSTVGNFTVGGNFVVSGDTTTLNTSTLSVEDLNITCASGAANSAAADGAGLTVAGASASIIYDHTGTQWEMNKPLEVTGTLAVTSTSTFTGAITASGGFANTTFDGGTY